MGVIIGLTAIAGICGVIHRWLLERDNKRLARLENEDVPLSERDIRKGSILRLRGSCRRDIGS
jgi:hypothetical protein